MKAIGYIRVSTEEQKRNGDSLAAQAEAIKKYCLQQKLTQVEILAEGGVSGDISIGKRPAGKTIANFIAEGVNNIVAVKLDRLFRNTIDALTQSNEWIKQDVALHLLDFGGQCLNTRSPEARMMFTMRAGFAQMERELIASRTQTAMDHKRSKGECLGQVPFGYERIGEKLIKLPSRQVMVNTIKELHELGYGSRFIANCIESDHRVKCSHATITNLIKKEIIPCLNETHPNQ